MNILHKLRIASRKIFLPIKRNDLVIDIGSGGNPSIYADVTTDMYDDTTQRFSQIKHKGLFVWANAEKLPFKSKVFDYSISSQVLEHTPYPERMISEIERISKAGYIETPPAWQELIRPYKMHYSRVAQIDNKLVFSMKETYNETLSDNFKDILSNLNQFKNYTEEKYTNFTVNKLYWSDNIDFEIIRKADYTPFKIELTPEIDIERRSKIQSYIITIITVIFKLYRPRKKIEELSLLCCPACRNDLNKDSQRLLCVNCNNVFFKHKGFWDFR